MSAAEISFDEATKFNVDEREGFWWPQDGEPKCSFMSANNCVQQQKFEIDEVDIDDILCTGCGRGHCHAHDKKTMSPSRVRDIFKHEGYTLEPIAHGEAAQITSAFNAPDTICIVFDLFGKDMNHATTLTKIVKGGPVYMDSNRDPTKAAKRLPYEANGNDFKYPGFAAIKPGDVQAWIAKNLMTAEPDKAGPKIVNAFRVTKKKPPAAGQEYLDWYNNDNYIRHHQKYRQQSDINYNLFPDDYRIDTGYYYVNHVNHVNIILGLLLVFMLMACCAIISLFCGGGIGYFVGKNIVLNKKKEYRQDVQV